MRRRIPTRRVLAAALLVASLLTPLAAAPATAAQPSRTSVGDDDCPRHELDPKLVSRLDTAIEKVRREAGIPGVVAGLWMPGKGSYVRATGVADKATGRPMTSDVFVRIGSETKTFTVTALLELVDDGLIRLDDPISRYIHGVPNGHRITLRHLAEMRSGLYPYTADADFQHDLLSDPARHFTPREVLAYGFKHKNTFAPGAKFEYSNTNLILLGLVIEKVTGQPLQQVLKQQVIDPAGLHHTLFPTNADFPSPHAQGYTDQSASGEIVNSTDWNPSWAWAAGAMISDLEDLRSWAKTLATGTLLTPATQAERLKTTSVGIPGAGYGLGLFDVQGWIGHNGSLPGYESLGVYLPQEQATLVVILNTDALHDGQEPSTLFGEAITEIVTPNHVYPGHKPTPPRHG